MPGHISDPTRLNGRQYPNCLGTYVRTFVFSQEWRGSACMMARFTHTVCVRNVATFLLLLKPGGAYNSGDAKRIDGKVARDGGDRQG